MQQLYYFFSCLISYFTLERKKVFIKIIPNITAFFFGCRNGCIAHFFSLLRSCVTSTAWHATTVWARPVHAEEILSFPERCIQAVWGKYWIWAGRCFSWLLMGLPACIRVETWCSWRKFNTNWTQCHFKVSLKLWFSFYSDWWLTENHVKRFLGCTSGSAPSLLCGRASMSNTSNATLPHGTQIQLSFHLGSSFSVHIWCPKA